MNTDRNTLRSVLREKFPRDHGQLLPALHFLQHEFGYLPDWGMEVVGWHLGIPASEVYGAATSYTELRTTAPGSHVIRVCTGLGCRINGAGEILETVRESFAEANGKETTIEETPCGFLCGMAPALEIDGVWHGRVDADSVKAQLEELS
ncbi:MAG: NAD(P)H-dependent oxidoreductase subunit E [Chloroflexi bacterium]|nr:NAD(P)H-dependent oxidoreductase subunit E [Chloroflexota bacterium]